MRLTFNIPKISWRDKLQNHRHIINSIIGTGFRCHMSLQLRCLVIALDWCPWWWLIGLQRSCFRLLDRKQHSGNQEYINFLLDFSEKFHCLAQIGVMMVIASPLYYEVLRGQPISLCLCYEESDFFFIEVNHFILVRQSKRKQEREHKISFLD